MGTWAYWRAVAAESCRDAMTASGLPGKRLRGRWIVAQIVRWLVVAAILGLLLSAAQIQADRAWIGGGIVAVVLMMTWGLMATPPEREERLVEAAVAEGASALRAANGESARLSSELASVMAELSRLRDASPTMVAVRALLASPLTDREGNAATVAHLFLKWRRVFRRRGTPNDGVTEDTWQYWLHQGKPMGGVDSDYRVEMARLSEVAHQSLMLLAHHDLIEPAAARGYGTDRWVTTKHAPAFFDELRRSAGFVPLTGTPE